MITVEVEAKPCAECGKLMLKCHHKPSRWDVVKYCGISCAIKAREDKPMVAWKSETKTCINCGRTFGPERWSKRRDWNQRETCSRSCFQRSWRGSEFTLSDIDPKNCTTKGQRVKFLRLSESECGSKKPISNNEFRSICRMGDMTIKAIESDNPNITGWEKQVCAALRVPISILTIPLEKWLAVVQNAKLKAAEMTKIRKPTES
jgi:hypothetical protein